MPERFDRIVMSMDTAFKEKEQNDYSAVVIAGVLDLRIYLLFAAKVKVEFPTLKKMTGLWWLMWGRPDALLIEDAASGQALIQELAAPVKVERNGVEEEVWIPVLPVAPLGDKVARAEAAAPMVAAGQVYLPDPQALSNATWVPWFLVDTATFPRGEGHDLVDALSQLLNYLRGGGAFAGLMAYQRAQVERIQAGRRIPLCVRCKKPILDNVPFSRDASGVFHSPRCPGS
jgi:predicted phage terminase large subunit-like protein